MKSERFYVMEMWVDIQTKSYHCISSSKISSTTPVRSNLTAVHAVPWGQMDMVITIV